MHKEFRKICRVVGAIDRSIITINVSGRQSIGVIVAIEENQPPDCHFNFVIVFVDHTVTIRIDIQIRANRRHLQRSAADNAFCSAGAETSVAVSAGLGMCPGQGQQAPEYMPRGKYSRRPSSHTGMSGSFLSAVPTPSSLFTDTSMPPRPSWLPL